MGDRVTAAAATGSPETQRGVRPPVEVTSCRNCHHAVINAKRLARSLEGAVADRAEEAGGTTERPLMPHQRFRVAVAGCANACSQPQVKDFGIIGQWIPARGAGPCDHGGACVEVCREEAIRLEEDGPVIDYSTCVNCGDCIRACRTGAIITQARGVRVLLGGKLGRHPRLAETLVPLVPEGEVARLLAGCLELEARHAKPGERFGALIERLGMEAVRKEVLTP